jgi:hypothetical protein
LALIGVVYAIIIYKLEIISSMDVNIMLIYGTRDPFIFVED